jgi:hypothetical protein
MERCFTEKFESTINRHLETPDTAMSESARQSLIVYGNNLSVVARFQGGISFITRDAGGGGDCFYHSVAYLLNEKPGVSHSVKSLRELAAKCINVENIHTVLRDMMGSYLKSDETASPTQVGHNTDKFNPALVWNLMVCTQDVHSALAAVREAVSRCGNFYWGDVTTAALLEDALKINIICLSKKKDGSIMASRSYIGMINDMFEHNEANKARCMKNVNPNYDTIIILNHGNYHWTPICCVMNAATSGNPTQLYCQIPPDVIKNLDFLYV